MKKFLIKISYTLLPAYLFLIGITFYYNLIIKPKETGDLGRAGGIPFNRACNEKTLSGLNFKNIKNIEDLNICKSDVLIIGDSFSQQGEKGYQNYMNSNNNMSIANYAPINVVFQNPFQSAYDLINLGYADSIGCNTIIIESVERSIANRLEKITFTNKSLQTVPANKTKPKQSLLLDANNYIRKNVLKILGLFKTVRHEKLSDSLFSGKYANDLFFFEDDITRGTSIDTSKYNIIRNNLNRLFQKAEENNIKIYVLIAVDKYDLYQKHIINNPYPKKTINEDLQIITKQDDRIIYTKSILQPLIDSGEKDVFYVDDTHWSTKGASAVGNYLREMLK